MPMRCRPATAILLSLALTASGCDGGSSVPSTHGGSAASSGRVEGTLEGRVFTTACGGPAAASCLPESYRGSLALCRTMGQLGPCPSVRVGARGRYRITLRSGRYALIPAPGKGNVVFVRPRWVTITAGRITTLNIDGGNLMR